MPRLHILGQLLGASGFSESDIFCQYRVVFDKETFSVLEGKIDGCTQTASDKVGALYILSIAHITKEF